MSADTEIPLKSVAQLAAHLGVSKTFVYAHCRADAEQFWPHEVIAGQFKFTASQVEQILALQRASQPTDLAQAQRGVVQLDPARLARAARRRTNAA